MTTIRRLKHKINNLTWFVIPVFLFLFPLPGKPQEYLADVQHFGIADGLSHREVASILQDSRGFMWLGTPFGLNRFDGVKFQWWTKEKDGLPDNDIKGLVEDAEGDLWITSDYSSNDIFCVRTICFLNIYTGQVRTLEQKFGKAGLPVPLRDIANYWCTDTEKTVYFGTRTAAKIISWHPGSGFRVFPLPGYGSFRPAGVSAKNTIWGIADSHVWLEISYTGEVLQVHRDTGNLSPRKHAIQDRDLIFETSLTGQPLRFVKIDQAGKEQLMDAKDLHCPVDCLGQSIKSLFANPRTHNLWVFSQNYLPVIHPEKGLLLNFYDQYPELKDDPSIGFRTVASDAVGGVWLGSNFGVYRVKINKNHFRRYLYHPPDHPTRDNLSDNSFAKTSCRGIGKYGNLLFINTERNGLKIFDLKTPGQPQPLREVQVVAPPDLNKAYAFLKDSENTIWIGEHRLHRYDPASGNLSLVENKNPANDQTVIWTMCEDRKKDIWLGRGTGLQRLDRASNQVVPFDRYNSFQELSKAPVTYIGKDRTGTIWICATTGLYTLDIEKGITARYWSGGKPPFYLPQDKIHHIYQDSAGIFWLGTAGGGLIRWEKANAAFRQFTRVDGLPNNNIYAVYEDKRQHLWMSSDYGIIQFDKKNYQSKTYLPQDGITHYEFNRTSHFQDRDGRIWFGGLNGVTSFDPEDFYTNNRTAHPPLQITAVHQFDGSTNRLVDKTGELLTSNRITLHPGDRFIQLEFALLTYENTSQIRYAYKVEGVDRDWTYQPERSIRMSRLPYGNHILKIKGQAADGQWSDNTLAITVNVLRPFYVQVWFLLVLGIAVLGLALGLYKWRTWEYKHNQRRLEQEVAFQTATIRQQAEALQELDQTKSRFFANISHEFRTPLTVIKGLAADISGDVQAKTLINRNADNLLRLINQLLNLSKIESGSLKLNLVQADIVHYLQYLTESFYSMAEEKKIRLTFYSEIPELVMDFDEDKIQHVVYNLLSNAIKFTPSDSGEKVIFHVRRTDENERPVLQLKIQDTGTGIPASELPHVFDWFYQAPQTAITEEKGRSLASFGKKAEGTGIGLALSKELVELMGGRISVESELGKGTQFTILLPIAHEAPLATPANSDVLAAPEVSNAAEDIQPVQALTGPERPLLLIIEDNRDVVTYMKRLLKNDYQIETAPNGQTGIEMAFDLVPDVVISDVMMPEKDGYAVCETLKNDGRTSHIPIILLTAKAAETDKIDGLKSGADAYLMKPFNKEELFIRLEKLLELRRTLQERYADAQLASSQPVYKIEPTLDDQFIQHIQQVIQENISNSDLGIAQLCTAVHLSHTQVFRKLKALTGENPTAYIRKIRLHRAMKLLRNTDRQVSNIAYEVGFSDPNYFSRVFSEEFGMPPSAVRD